MTDTTMNGSPFLDKHSLIIISQLLRGGNVSSVFSARERDLVKHADQIHQLGDALPTAMTLLTRVADYVNPLDAIEILREAYLEDSLDDARYMLEGCISEERMMTLEQMREGLNQHISAPIAVNLLGEASSRKVQPETNKRPWFNADAMNSFE